MAVKKTPMRMCLACREMKPKKDLMRVVKSPDGSIFIDDTFKANGRGAYLCNSAACVDKCVRQNAQQTIRLCRGRGSVFVAEKQGK